MIHDTAQTVSVRVAPSLHSLSSMSWHNIDRRQNENLPVLPVNQNKRQHLHDSRVGVPKQMEIYTRNSILKEEIFSAREQHSFAIHM